MILTRFLVSILAVFYLTNFTAISSQIVGTHEDRLKKYRLGRDLFTKKKYTEASKLFLAFIEEEPQEYDVRNALYLLGTIKKKGRDYFEAIKYFRRLHVRYPHSRHKAAALFFESFCYKKVGLKAKAIAGFREYIKKHSQGKYRLMSNVYLGDIYFQTKNFPKAIKYYSRANILLLKNKNKKDSKKKKNLTTKIHYRLGIIYSKRYRNVPLAYKYLSKLLKEPNFKEKENVKFILRDISFYYLTAANGLPGNTISSIEFDGDDVWIGTWLNGVARYSRSNNRIKRFNTDNGLLSDAVRDVLVDFDEVWISTYDGISLFSKKSDSFKKIPYSGNNGNNGKKTSPPKNVQKIFKDGRYIYFSTLGDGVKRYDRVKLLMEPFASKKLLKKYDVQKINGNNKYLAFATLDHGAIIYNKSEQTFFYLNKSQGLPGNTINDIIFDGKYLWLAVHGFGIVKFDLKKRKIRHYKPARNGVHAMPICLNKRGHELWVGTMGGGVRILNLMTDSWKKITVIDGLPTNDIRLVEFEENYVWLGSLDKGITIIYRPMESDL